MPCSYILDPGSWKPLRCLQYSTKGLGCRDGALPDRGTRENTDTVSKCYCWGHACNLRKRKWHSRRGSSPKAVVLAFPDLSRFALFHVTPSASSLELHKVSSADSTMADYSDLFTLARSTEAFIPSTDALADPFYVQKLNRLQRSWIE